MYENHSVTADADADVDVSRSEEIPARLCAWRIFGSMRGYSDRSTGHSWQSESVALPSGITVSVTVGNVPDIVIESLRSWRVQRNYVLDNLFGNAYAGMSLAERREVLAAQEAEQDIEEFKGYVTFLAIEASRPVTVMGHPSARFLWIAAGAPRADEFESFEREASTTFDGLGAWLLPTVEPSLEMGPILLGGARAYLVAQGKAATAIPRMTGSGRPSVTGPGWPTLPFEALQSKLATYQRNSTQIDRHLTSASHWLALALAEEDHLRQFVFAYGGLEVLVQKAQARVRDLLRTDLEREVPTLPFRELLWPDKSDELEPDRNLVFKFASLASVVSPSTATADTAQFKMIAKVRNHLAHGSAEDPESVPVREVVKLLCAYLAATATAIEDGRLS